MKYVISSLSLLLAISFIHSGYAQNNAEKDAIKAQVTVLTGSLKAKDMDGIDKVFADDALLKFPGKPALKGKEAILKAHEPMMKQGINIKCVTEEIFLKGTMATEIGTYKILVPDGTVVDQGSYATVWKKTNGTWTISRDIISSSGPPQDQGK